MKNFTFSLLLFLPQFLFALPQNCPDTLVLKTGERWAVRVTKVKNDLIYYRDCRDSQPFEYTLPKNLVERVISEDPEFRTGETSEEEKTRAADLKLQKEGQQIKALGVWSGLLLFVFGIGLILGIVTLVRGSKFLKRTKKMPRTPFLKKLRRKVKFGMWATLLLPVILAIIVGLLFLATFSLDFDFGP